MSDLYNNNQIRTLSNCLNNFVYFKIILFLEMSTEIVDLTPYVLESSLSRADAKTFTLTVQKHSSKLFMLKEIHLF